MKPTIGMIGNGNVGSALARGLERGGYAVRAVGNEPAKIKETGQWADVVILAVPYGAVDDAVRELGASIQGSAEPSPADRAS
jgi:predicted dinucleotide-binding enzyme